MLWNIKLVKMEVRERESERRKKRKKKLWTKYTTKMSNHLFSFFNCNKIYVGTNYWIYVFFYIGVNYSSKPFNLFEVIDQVESFIILCVWMCVFCVCLNLKLSSPNFKLQKDYRKNILAVLFKLLTISWKNSVFFVIGLGLIFIIKT